MDQAGTLRALLGQTKYNIEPIIADVGSIYLRPLCQALLKYNARVELGSLIFDGGFLVREPSRQRDLMRVLENRASLEDISKALLPNQYLVQAVQAFSYLTSHSHAMSGFEKKMHRLPGHCDNLYATLSQSQVVLATRFAKKGSCYWLVEPTSKSVTGTFRAIRYSIKRADHLQHRIIVVGVSEVAQADEVFARFQEVISKDDSSTLQYCGHVPKLIAGEIDHKASQAMERVVKVMSGTSQLACI